jgi:hypothetical protein
MDYENSAWDDFAANQIGPFENIPMPFYLGVGNHEIIAPKNRCQFSKQFARLLEKPELHNRKTDSVSGTPATSKPANARNSKSDAVEAPQSDAVKECIRQCVDCSPNDSKTYYWTKDGVDFVYLDNSSNEQFDTDQLKWFNDVIKNDTDDKTIRTVVVGMHKALPWSISCDHGMNESPEGTKSGEQVYRTLLNLQKPDKQGVRAGKPFALLHAGHLQYQALARRWRHIARLDRWDCRRRALSAASVGRSGKVEDLRLRVHPRSGLS